MKDVAVAGFNAGLLARLEEIVEAKLEYVVIAHDRSLRVSAWGLTTKGQAFAAICAIALSVTLPVIIDRGIESFSQLDSVFERAKLYVRGIIAATFTVVSAAAQRVVIAAAIDVRSTDYAKSSVSTHRSF